MIFPSKKIPGIAKRNRQIPSQIWAGTKSGCSHPISGTLRKYNKNDSAYVIMLRIIV